MCFVNNRFTIWAFIQTEVMFSLNPHCGISQLFLHVSHTPEEHYTMKAVFVTQSVIWHTSLEVC